jgi:hypothetical protein
MERLLSVEVVPGTVVISVGSEDRASKPRVLRMHMILRPRRTSRLDLLPTIGAFAIAHGVRKTTGVVARIRPPNKAVIEDRIVGNAFAKVKKVGGSESYVVLDLRVKCTIRSTQLGDLLATSPWPKDIVVLDPDILMEKILESFDWIYSEWERGMDRTLEGRIRPTPDGFLP